MERKEQIPLNWLQAQRMISYRKRAYDPVRRIFPSACIAYIILDRVFLDTSRGAVHLADKGHLYLGDALGYDVIRERRELLLQLMEQLHDSDVRAMTLPHRGPPSSWQGLPVGARSIVTPVHSIRPGKEYARR